MYCAWRIPAHLRCTQCSILLHLMDICFLTCICLWQISQIQTFLFKVVGPGLVSTSPAFVSSRLVSSATLIDLTTDLIMPNNSSKKTQPARGWNAAEICTNCVYTIPAPKDGGPIPFLRKPAVAPCHLAGSASHKSGDVESNPGPATHTKNTLQSFGFVTSVTNK